MRLAPQRPRSCDGVHTLEDKRCTGHEDIRTTFDTYQSGSRPGGGSRRRARCPPSAAGGNHFAYVLPPAKDGDAEGVDLDQGQSHEQKGLWS